MKNPLITIRTTEQNLARYKAAAEARGTTVAAICREALEAAAGAKPTEEQTKEAQERG